MRGKPACGFFYLPFLVGSTLTGSCHVVGGTWSSLQSFGKGRSGGIGWDWQQQELKLTAVQATARMRAIDFIERILRGVSPCIEANSAAGVNLKMEFGCVFYIFGVFLFPEWYLLFFFFYL